MRRVTGLCCGGWKTGRCSRVVGEIMYGCIKINNGMVVEFMLCDIKMMTRQDGR